jgi:hypothetical protein
MSAGAETVFDSGFGGYKLSGTVNAVSWTVQSSSLVSYFNSISACGKTDWTINVAADITGLTNCGGNDVASQGDAYTDKYATNGTSMILNNFDGTTFFRQ